MKGEKQIKGLSGPGSERPGKTPASPSQGSSGMAKYRQSSRHRDWLFSLLLMAVTLLAYRPALSGKFVWDDDAWTTKISGLLGDFHGLRLMWCQPTALQQYYPLAGTTFWVDNHLWGFWPLPYHVENVLLHVLAALLFWQLLRRLRVPGGWLAAAIFALHPVMVESVGWITERKNVLSLALYLGALLAYGKFVLFWKSDDDAPERNIPARRWSAYGLAFFLFLGALLAKTTTFSLPAVILLICWWKRGRIRWRADALPVLPFFALSIGLCLVTAWLEKNHVGAKGADWMIPFPDRCLIAGRAPWFYIGKLLWPANLCFVYPRWQLDAASLAQWLYAIAAAGVLMSLWLARKRLGRGPVAAACFFAGTLFPVLGFLNVFGMLYSFVWDHWVYLPSLGLIALVASLVARAAEHLRRPAVLHGFAAIVLPVLGLLTWRQCGMYADIETLWRTTLARNPNSFLAQNNLGAALYQRGQVDEAIIRYQKALAINPNDAEAIINLGKALLQKGKADEAMACFQKGLEIRRDFTDFYNNMGDALLQKGQVDEAITQFQKALEIHPQYAPAHNNLGNALLRKGRVDEAIEQFQRAIDIQPGLKPAHSNLGNTLIQQGRVDEAIEQFQKAIEIQPDDVAIQNNLGYALLQKGRVDEAIAQFQSALKMQPEFAEAHYNLGITLLQQGRVDEAAIHFRKTFEIQPQHWLACANLGVILFQKGQMDKAVTCFQRALEIQPDNAMLCKNLAWILATCPDASVRNGTQAVQLAERAVRLSGGTDPTFISTLAATYANDGRFPEAVKTAQQARQLAAAQSNTTLVNDLQTQIELYQAGLPFRDASQSNPGPAK
jgi:protein O-mannosyl-transferase